MSSVALENRDQTRGLQPHLSNSPFEQETGMSVGHLFNLESRVALVTGGNGGLGLGMALGLAEAGAHIAVAARNTEKTATALSQIEATGVKALGLTADISRESDIIEMVA